MASSGTPRATMSERDHNGRLGRLEYEFQGLSKRVESVETTLTSHGHLLYEIRSAVTAQTVRSGSVVSEWIRVGSSLATTLAIVTTVLVYVAKSVAVGEFNTTVTELRVKLAAAEKRMDSGEFMRSWQTNTVTKGDRAQ